MPLLLFLSGSGPRHLAEFSLSVERSLIVEGYKGCLLNSEAIEHYQGNEGHGPLDCVDGPPAELGHDKIVQHHSDQGRD